jgi:hypothetical protein
MLNSDILVSPVRLLVQELFDGWFEDAWTESVIERWNTQRRESMHPYIYACVKATFQSRNSGDSPGLRMNEPLS